LNISDELMAELQGLRRISAAMGYAYNHFDTNRILKFRQSMDIFRDKILDMMNQRTVDLLVIKLYKEKMRKAIVESKH